MKSKRLFCLLSSSFLMLGALAACNGGDTSSSGDSSLAPTSSETSQAQGSSEAKKSKEEIIDELVNTTNITIESTSELTTGTEAAPSVMCDMTRKTKSVLQLAGDKIKLEGDVTGQVYEYPLSLFVHDELNPTDDEIKAQAEAAHMFPSAQPGQTLTITVDRTNEKVRGEYEYEDPDVMTLAYVTYDETAKQRVVYNEDGMDKGSLEYVTDSEYQQYVMMYSLLPYKSILLDLYEGTYNAETKTYTKEVSQGLNLNGQTMYIYEASMKVNNDVPVELELKAEYDVTYPMYLYQEADTIIKISNVGTTTVNVPEFDLPTCDHVYTGVNYEDLGDKCRPYCRECNKYLGEAVDHAYESDGKVCTHCAHLKDMEVYHSELVEDEYGCKVDLLYKASDNSYHMKVDSQNDLYVVKYQRDWVGVRSAYVPGDPGYNLDANYNPTLKKLVVVKRVGLETPATSCISTSQYTMSVYKDIQITFTDPDNAANELIDIAKLSKEEILATYAGSSLKGEITVNAHRPNHTCSSSDVTEIDECHTGYKYICDNCGLKYDGSISSHHTYEFNKVACPSYFDPSKYGSTYEGAIYLAQVCKICHEVNNDNLYIYKASTVTNANHGSVGSSPNVRCDEYYSGYDRIMPGQNVTLDHIYDEHDVCYFCHGEKITLTNESSEDSSIYSVTAIKDRMDFGASVFDYQFYLYGLAINGKAASATTTMSYNDGDKKYSCAYSSSYIVTAQKVGNTVTIELRNSSTSDLLAHGSYTVAA